MISKGSLIEFCIDPMILGNESTSFRNGIKTVIFSNEIVSEVFDRALNLCLVQPTPTINASKNKYIRRKKMENSFFGKDNNEDVEGIKNDIQSLVHRLGNLKDQSAVALTEQIEGLSSAIGDLKDKGVEIGRDNMAVMYAATRKNPLKMLMCAFGLGILACCLIKKKS